MNPLLDVDLTGRGGRKNPLLGIDLSTFRPPAEPSEPDSWEDQIKPSLIDTGKAMLRVPLHTAASFVQAPISGLAAAAKLITSGGDLAAANQVLRENQSALDEAYLTTPKERQASETVNLVMKPFQMAGEGLQEIVRLTPAKGTIAEPIAGAIGEISAMFGLPGVPKTAKAWWNGLPYRKRVMVVEQVQADIASGEFTGAELRELWKDPTNREALLKRYQGVGAEEGRPVRPAFNEPPESGKALPAGQGFELRPRPSEVEGIVDEMGRTPNLLLPPGQGFERRPRPGEVADIIGTMKGGNPLLPAPEGMGEGFTFQPAEAEAPIVTKAGQPFKTEKTAAKAGEGLDWNLYEVTPQEGGGFAITRKMGKELKEKGTPPRLILRGGEIVEEGTPKPVQQAPVSPVSYDVQKASDILFRPVDTWTPEERAYVLDNGGVMRLMSERKKPATAQPPGGELVQPESSSIAVEPVKKKSPEGIIGRINQGGGVNVYDDYNAPELRQFPDMARVMKKAGPKSDEWAAMLNDEGYPTGTGEPWTGDSLIESLKSGQARNVFTPDKAERIIDRQLRSEEHEWINQQLENLQDRIDPEAIKANQGNLQDGLIDEIASEGISYPDQEAALKEVSDFFDEATSKFRGVQEGVSRPFGYSSKGGAAFPELQGKAYEPEPASRLERISHESLGPEPEKSPVPADHRAVISAVPDKPWKWTADDLMDLRPSELDKKLEKIWGPEEEFTRWVEDYEGADKRRYWPLYDSAADLEYAIKNGDKGEVQTILKDIQSRLSPQDYYAYEEIQGTRGGAPVPENANQQAAGKIPTPKRTGAPAKTDRYNQADLPGLSNSETFELSNPVTEHARLTPKDRGPQTIGFDFGSQRGSLGDVSESEILNALLKTRGKIEQAMPHLETLGRSVYEGGKQRFLDWQAHMKTKLGDLWQAFKGHLKGIFERLKSGEIGPLGNQKGAVGSDINKGPIIKQREIKDAKTGEVRMAPAVRAKEFEAVQKMPELRQKPLGGWLENPIRTFEELGPEIKELFYRPVKEAEHLAKKHFQKIHEKSEEIRKALPRGSSERIGIYAVSQQKGGAEILDSMGIKEAPKLTPKELEVYRWMRNGLETFYNKLQEARAKAGKEGFGHVENYFTFARQFSLMEKLGFSPIFSRLALLENVMHRKTTPFQYEKHRVGGLTRADLDAFGVFNRYMESATRHYYLSPAIAKGREMTLTFHQPDGTKWILRDEKPGAAKFITEWLDFQAGQRKPQLPTLVEKMLTKLNKNLAFSVLSANIRSALIQPSAIVSTVTEIGPKWTFEGIRTMLDPTAIDKSNVLLSRQFDVNVTESLAGMPGKIGKAKQAVGNTLMKPLQFLDMQTAKATWNGAYRKGKADGLSEEAARNYADDTVTRTQGSAMPSDMAPAQRTPMGKFLTMFQTFVINQWGFLTRDVMGIHNASIKNPQAVKKVMTFILGTTLVNSFYEDVLGVPSPLPSPVSAFVKSLDKGEDLPSASVEAAAEIASLIPIIGGGMRYGSNMLGAGVDYIGDVGKKFAPNYVGPTRPAAELVAKGLGVPGTSQVSKSVRIANKGGSPVDVALGRWPEDARLVKPKTLKGLK